MKIKEFNATVEEVFREIEERHGDRIGRIVGISVDSWQALKAKYLKEGVESKGESKAYDFVADGMQ